VDLTLETAIEDRFRESLLKRKVGLVTTEVENVNPFFAKKERVDRKQIFHLDSDKYTPRGIHSENFPSIQHVGIFTSTTTVSHSNTITKSCRLPHAVDILYRQYFTSIFTYAPQQYATPLDVQLSRDFLVDSQLRVPTMGFSCTLISSSVATDGHHSPQLRNSFYFPSFTMRSLWLNYVGNTTSTLRTSSSLLQESLDKTATSLKDVSANVEEWLLSWSFRRNTKNQKKKRKASKWDDSYWDDSDDDEGDVSNLLALIGPGGCGKTSVVYSVAEKLGINVLEISACQLRSGVVVKKMIMEATQSHGVGKQHSCARSDNGLGLNLVLFDEVLLSPYKICIIM
jgi:hypothetical protein